MIGSRPPMLFSIPGGIYHALSSRSLTEAVATKSLAISTRGDKQQISKMCYEDLNGSRKADGRVGERSAISRCDIVACSTSP